MNLSCEPTKLTDVPPGRQDAFWVQLAALCARAEIVTDRPRGSRHPQYPDFVYPVDYGYLAGTSSSDGEELDVFIGSQSPRDLQAVVVVVDPVKCEVEVKLLLGCTAGERRQVLMTLERNALPFVVVDRRAAPAGAGWGGSP